MERGGDSWAVLVEAQTGRSTVEVCLPGFTEDEAMPTRYDPAILLPGIFQ